MYDTLISIAQAAELVSTRTCRLFDCSFDLGDPQKGGAIFAAGHLPDAQYLDLDHDLAGPVTGSNGRHPLPDPCILVDRLRRAGLNNGDQVIAYDNAGGPFAARLWWLLRWLGHDQVAVLDGGVGDWEAAGYLVERGKPVQPPRGNFAPGTIRTARVVDAAAVMDNLSTRAALLVDARAAPRFRGEILLMDAIAGHIPGARNRPYQDNLRPDGRFKSSATLRGEFQATIAGFEPGQVILQCGSGVTACHNALAMEHVGLTGARLYPGSWSEWTSDRSRPIELGELVSLQGQRHDER